MSKLNDSTLKILKKYRLDTDMSVFGNENKLHDVVKVMDDMVGNQVSKYVAKVSYLSSTQTQSAPFYTANGGSSVDVQKNQFINKNRYTDIVLYFHPFTFKYLGSVPANSTVVPAASIVDETLTSICYVGIDLITGTVSTYSDLQCSIKIEINFENGKQYTFMQLCKISNSTSGFGYGTSVSISEMMSNGGTSSQVNNQPKNSEAPIVIPKEVEMLDLSKPTYASHGEILKTSISCYDIGFTEAPIIEV